MISKRRQSSFILKKRRGLGIVIIGIMTLVGGTILASGVVIYGTSLFQGGALQESISVGGIKLWLHGTSTDGLAWGAFAVRNTGDKVVSVDKIAIRGNEVPFASWYPDTTVTAALIQQPMNFTGWSGVGGMLAIDGPDSCTGQIVEVALGTAGDVCADATSGPVSLDPGKAAIIYFKLNNGTFTTVDGGASTSVGVFAGKVGAPQSISISSKT